MEIVSRFSQLHVGEDDEVIDESERDRLSELPDSLILSILSFLTMFDVVRTTILSKRWKDLWANAILNLKNRHWKYSMPRDCQLFRSISHVEKLTLSKWFIKCLLDLKKRNMDVPLSSNAKFLKLYAYRAEEILVVLDIFPKLMHTVIDFEVDEPRCLCSFCSPSVVELKTVEITWSIRDASIFRVIEYLLGNAHKLEKMVLRLRMAGANSETFVSVEEKVRSMPRSSLAAQVFISKKI